MAELNRVYSAVEIMQSLPHRFPIILVDRVTEITDNGGKGYKNISMNEAIFQGHFPGSPIYPGVYILEGLAQCAGFIALRKIEAKDDPAQGKKERLTYFMMIDGVKFRKMVVPGDRLDYEIEFIKQSSKIVKFKAVAKVNGELAAEAEMTAMMDEKK